MRLIDLWKRTWVLVVTSQEDQTPLNLLMTEDVIQTFNDQGPNIQNHVITFCLQLKI